MTQLDLLAKNFIGACSRREDVVGIRYVNPKEANFEEMYNEEVNFLANTIGVCHANYPRLGVTQGCIRDEGWRDRDREWRGRNTTWKEKYVPPQEHQKPKDLELSTRLKGPIKF